MEYFDKRNIFCRNLFPTFKLWVVPRPTPSGRESEDWDREQVPQPGGSLHSLQQDQPHREEETAAPQPPERFPGPGRQLNSVIVDDGIHAFSESFLFY